MIRAVLAILYALMLVASVEAQPVTVIGPITPNHCAAFNSTTVLKDGGVCGGGGGGAARTALTQPTVFWVGDLGTDTVGCGVTTMAPCLTVDYMYNQELFNRWDLQGFGITIGLLNTTHTENFTAHFRLLGESLSPNVVLAPATTTTWTGFINLDPGSSLWVRGLRMEGTGAQCSFTITAGANLVREGITYGKNSGQCDDQPTTNSRVTIVSDTTIDKPVFFSTGTLNVGGSTTITGLSSTATLSPGMCVGEVTNATSPYGILKYNHLPPFARILTVDSGTQVTLDRATPSVTTAGAGLNLLFMEAEQAHFQVDQNSIIFYAQAFAIGGPSPEAVIINNAACYESAFISLDHNSWISLQGVIQPSQVIPFVQNGATTTGRVSGTTLTTSGTTGTILTGMGVYGGNIPTGTIIASGTGPTYTLNNSLNITPILTLGAITAGSGGTAGTYFPVTLTGGTGSGAVAQITVTGGGVTAVTVVTPGNGYTVGDVLSASSAAIGNTTGFAVPVTAVGEAMRLGFPAQVLGGPPFALFDGSTKIDGSDLNNGAGPDLAATPGVVLTSNNGLTVLGTTTAGSNVVSVSSPVAQLVSYYMTTFPAYRGLQIAGSGIPPASSIPDSSFVDLSGNTLTMTKAATASNTVVLKIGGFANNGGTNLGLYNDPPIEVSTSRILPLVGIAGSIPYWNGGNWSALNGNLSGTQVFSENATGVPSWLNGAQLGGLLCAPNKQVFNTGASATYTTPTCNTILPKYLDVRLVGPGGGGGGSGSGGGMTAGGTPAAATLCTVSGCGSGTVYQANAGAGGATSGTGAGGTGGTTSGCDADSVTGANGGTSSVTGTNGGDGGSSVLGGRGAPGANGSTAGGAAKAGSGSGGGGGFGGGSFVGGGGGAAGGYCSVLIGTVVSSYFYTLPAGGAGGAAGTTGFVGGAGAAPQLSITAHWQ